MFFKLVTYAEASKLFNLFQRYIFRSIQYKDIFDYFLYYISYKFIEKRNKNKLQQNRF